MKQDIYNFTSADYLKLTEYSDISTSFPDEWILLANPIFNENLEITKGIVLFHSKDKKDVCYQGRDMVKEFEKISLIYTGHFDNIKRVGIMKRV